ncbi:MAG TPA: Rossmann-like and DUF2520 domain-containing protein [Pyrinomonadaceae bacterium]|nr:Rossmann-like and DUF2520 domain-containing protein [Pyrinomonadaceae bacterium]
MLTVTIIGTGRMGGALAIALTRVGYTIDKFVIRSPRSDLPFSRDINGSPAVSNWEDLDAISSELILITTQDSEIANAANSLKPFVTAGQVVLHTSGSLSSAALSGLKGTKASVGSVHPLVAISDAASGAEKFAGSYFCLEGDDEAVAVARDIVSNMGGKAFSVDTRFKPLYHAGAVMAAGHVVALLSMSLEMLTKCGIMETEALEILKPLVKSTFDNCFAVGPERALTGPFARADTETFDHHLKILRETVNENVLETYLSLAERSLEIAAERQKQPMRFENLLEKVLIEKKRTEC